MSKEEIALELTKVINDNMQKCSENYLTEKGVVSTYKRVLDNLYMENTAEELIETQETNAIMK